jgi:hypothetical protein
MPESKLSTIWVFHGEDAMFASAVFTEQSLAEAWIKQHSLSGVLTEYPLDVGIYEWVISKGYWKPKFPSHKSARFIGRFTSASQKHDHYRNGERKT